MRIALLDCHKNQLQESEKIVSALKKENADVIVDLFEVRKFQFPKEEYDALVISGADGHGKKHAWVRMITDYVDDFLKKRKPVLGVCYGHQLLGVTHGYDEITLKKPEVGWADVTLTEKGKNDPLFRGLPEKLPIFQYHIRAVSGIEKEKILAKNEACIQAVKYGPKTYGVQFHAEESPTSGSAYLENDPKCDDFEEATQLKPADHVEWIIFKNFVGIVRGDASK